MMWDEVMSRIATEIENDATMTRIFQGHFRHAGTSEMQIPGIEYTLLSDTETELWAPMLVQFDLWTAKAADCRAGERKLRGMFQQNRTIELDGVTMFSEYSDASDLMTPDRSGFVGRGVRFTFTPLRQQYALPAH
jgi:hypothetical protein